MFNIRIFIRHMIKKYETKTVEYQFECELVCAFIAWICYFFLIYLSTNVFIDLQKHSVHIIKSSMATSRAKKDQKYKHYTAPHHALSLECLSPRTLVSSSLDWSSLWYMYIKRQRSPVRLSVCLRYMITKTVVSSVGPEPFCGLLFRVKTLKPQNTCQSRKTPHLHVKVIFGMTGIHIFRPSRSRNNKFYVILLSNLR